MIKYDLHVHSTSSDGDLSPRELISAAAEQNVAVIALTDHDTVSGCKEAAEEAEKRGIGFVPGIEISCSELDKLHIIGLGLDFSNAELIGEMSKCADSRRQRTYRICEVLAGMGAKVDPEKINSSVRGNVGKPHIARELINNGYAESVRDAFAKYLTDPRIESIKKYELGYAEAISLIHNAGGLAVLAHPYQLKLIDTELDSFVGKLRESGLDGIECWYSAYTPEMTQQYLALSEKYDLLVSVGSDHHGATVKPDIHLATGINDSIIKLRELFPFECERCILNRLNILRCNMETGWLTNEKTEKRISNTSGSLVLRNKKMEELKEKLVRETKVPDDIRVSVAGYTGLTDLRDGEQILFGSFKDDKLIKYAIVTYNKNDSSGLWTQAGDGRRMLIHTDKINNDIWKSVE